MMDEIYESVRENMDASIEAFKTQLTRIRTGRASVTLLDPIRVNYYGSMTPLNQIASLSVPESDLIVIQAWDASALGEIMKAIQKSDLGINPANDGKVIRLKIPPLTEERRNDLVRQVKKLAEDAKIGARNHRRDANDTIKKRLKAKEVSEDQAHNGYGEVQTITDEYVKLIDEAAGEKETEITTL